MKCNYQAAPVQAFKKHNLSANARQMDLAAVNRLLKDEDVP